MKSSTNKWFSTVSLLLIFGLLIFLGWYFSAITIYIIISLIVVLLCLPMKRLLEKIHFKQFKVGNTLSSTLSLAIVGGVLFGLFAILFVPFSEQLKQVTALESSNFDQLNQTLGHIDHLLKDYNILSEDENLEQILTSATLNYFRGINLSSTFSSVFQWIGGLFLGILSVFFISFFVLKDIPSFKRVAVNMVSTEQQSKMTLILDRSKSLLSNYFVGLFVEMLIITILQYILLILLGIENALLISVVCGVLVIVPYIGVVIACIAGCLIAVLSAFTAGSDVDTAMIVWKSLAAIVFCRMLDSFLLYPYIAAKSVKAHPLEVFIVVLVSGSLAGVTGMILGIPAYTVIRIIAMEFFGDYNFVKTATQSLSIENEGKELKIKEE